MNYNVTIRISRHGEFENTESLSVEISDNTTEVNKVEALMDAVRPELNEQFEDDDDWENGDMTWELCDWSQE